jgi:DNA-binding response OmpR family regulator
MTPLAERPQETEPRIGARTQILVVEDDAAVSKLIKTYLERKGYDVVVVESVRAMRTAVDCAPVDMVILDVVQPDDDGWSALRWLRARHGLPVLMLTGKTEPVDRVIELELGADDYVAKPFDLRELLMRLRTIERRLDRAPAQPPPLAEPVRFADWTLDIVGRRLRSDAGETVHLTQAEYRILMLLVRNPRRVVSRDELMDVTAGRDWEPFDRSIDVHISNLRRKIDTDPKQPSLIRTVRGAGYMFMPQRG